MLPTRAWDCAKKKDQGISRGILFCNFSSKIIVSILLIISARDVLKAENIWNKLFDYVLFLLMQLIYVINESFT